MEEGKRELCEANAEKVRNMLSPMYTLIELIKSGDTCSDFFNSCTDKTERSLNRLIKLMDSIDYEEED